MQPHNENGTSKQPKRRSRVSQGISAELDKLWQEFRDLDTATTYHWVETAKKVVSLLSDFYGVRTPRVHSGDGLDNWVACYNRFFEDITLSVRRDIQPLYERTAAFETILHEYRHHLQLCWGIYRNKDYFEIEWKKRPTEKDANRYEERILGQVMGLEETRRRKRIADWKCRIKRGEKKCPVCGNRKLEMNEESGVVVCDECGWRLQI